jgi:hypothetical protein
LAYRKRVTPTTFRSPLEEDAVIDGMNLREMCTLHKNQQMIRLLGRESVCPLPHEEQKGAK